MKGQQDQHDLPLRHNDVALLTQGIFAKFRSLLFSPPAAINQTNVRFETDKLQKV